MIKITLPNMEESRLRHSVCEDHYSLIVSGEYDAGATLVFTSSEPFLWVQPDAAMAASLVYLPERSFEYRIPQGEQRLPYSPQAFAGDIHLVRAWLPTQEEITRKRNLAHNSADQRGDTAAYPHITANVETRDEAVFAARNVIDGGLENVSHGSWPYQSWGIGGREDACCTLDFGREVQVMQMALVLRADFPHDAYWTQGKVVLSDGTEVCFPLKKTGERQWIEIGCHTVRWMRLEGFVKSDDPSAFASLTEWEVYGTEA